MGRSTAETIKQITKQHLKEGNGLLLGQCVSAVGWIGGTVPDDLGSDCNGIIEIPMTDVAGPAFAVGCALMGRRPIFVVRYQGFMWYNASSLVNYAARSKEVWGRAAPVFIRAIAMEGNGIGHTASSSLHSIFMHPPGLPVAAPMSSKEYQAVWDYFISHDDPIYVSEHRRSFPLTEELQDELEPNPEVTLIGISAARLNILEAAKQLRAQGVKVNIAHLLWLKPFAPSEKLLDSVKRSKVSIIVDSDFEIAGASRSLAYELMHLTGAKVYALGLEDRVCGVSVRTENITPSSQKIINTVSELLIKNKRSYET